MLVVEDDPTLRDVLTVALSAQGCLVRWTDDGDRALAECEARLPEIVVLDVMLPGRSGLEVCAALRALYNPSPGVVMVTAKDSEVDVILGFEVGADDYVIKPFRPKELVARVKALSRRLKQRTPSTPPVEEPEAAMVWGPLKIDPGARSVEVSGNPVQLTPTELSLLAFLARVPNRVYSRMQLLERIWDSTHEGYARNVDCHITRIRRKLEKAGLDPAPINTVHGTGYSFVIPRC